LYVDDLLIIGNHLEKIERLNKLEIQFEMKNLGLMRLYLGVEFLKANKRIFMMQG
jgi:hypothetical protein